MTGDTIDAVIVFLAAGLPSARAAPQADDKPYLGKRDGIVFNRLFKLALYGGPGFQLRRRPGV